MIWDPERYDAVIFDMDGTLLDSMWMWKQIDVDFLGRFGIPMPADLQKQIEGMCFSETARYFKDRFRIPMTVEEIMDCWNGMTMEYYRDRTQLKPGVREFMERVRADGRAMGIATSNSRELAYAALERHGIKEYLTAILTGSEVTVGKPAPDMFLKTAALVGAQPEKCLVFEDVEAGVIAARRAGMSVIVMADPWCLCPKERMRELSDGYINDFREVFK